MALPRTVKLPWSSNGRGGLLLTSPANQGAEATDQMIASLVVPPGRTLHPWLQDKGQREDIVFSNPARAKHDLITRTRAIFARLEARDRARLEPNTLRVEFHHGADPVTGDARSRGVVSFTYEDLRRGEKRDVEVEVF